MSNTESSSTNNSASTSIVPTTEFLTNVTNKWKLNPTLSDTMEPMFEFMGIPWLIRKAILAAPPPSLVIYANAEILRIEQQGFSNLINEYRWHDKTHTHKVPNGSYPAQLEVLNNGTVVKLSVTVEKTRHLILLYEVDSTKSPIQVIATITFWMDGKDKQSIKRIFQPKV